MNKMKRILNFALILCAVAAASSCTFVRINKNAFDGFNSEHVSPSKDIATNTYGVPQFTAIESTIGADIDYVMTEGEPSITVEAPENYIDHLNFKVEDGVLKVRFDDNKNYSFGRVNVKASSATLEKLSILGAGDFDCDGLESSGMDVNVSGAGDVTFNNLKCSGDVSVTVRGAGDIDILGLSCQDISVEIMGAGDARLSGSAASAHLSIKGAGDIDASMLDCEDVSTSVAGMGSIRRK